MNKQLNIIIFSIFFLFPSCRFGKAKNNTLDIDNNNIDKLLIEARKYYEADRYLQAYQYFDKIISMDTTIGEAYYGRAYCLARRGNHQKSNEDFLKSIELDYRTADAYYNLGGNYFVLDKDSLAIMYLKKCLELDPHNEDAEEQIRFINMETEERLLHYRKLFFGE